MQNVLSFVMIFVVVMVLGESTENSTVCRLGVNLNDFKHAYTCDCETTTIVCGCNVTDTDIYLSIYKTFLIGNTFEFLYSRRVVQVLLSNQNTFNSNDYKAKAYVANPVSPNADEIFLWVESNTTYKLCRAQPFGCCENLQLNKTCKLPTIGNRYHELVLKKDWRCQDINNASLLLWANAYFSEINHYYSYSCLVQVSETQYRQAYFVSGGAFDMRVQVQCKVT